MMSALPSTVSALPGGFRHYIPCTTFHSPYVAQMRWTRRFCLPTDENKTISSVKFRKNPCQCYYFVGLLLMILFCRNRCILSSWTSFCPNAQARPCATELLADYVQAFPLRGAGSASPGPNARIYRCATKPPCRVLAGLPVPGNVGQQTH